ncbi:helix-turn-helix domain-containing protein [Antarcticibacterium sp. 1MA-6-2]|uniref:helix-turn-helix domain-containing protein n=1 Tax=Antarcticibacterium sp. 1MA-6-2 TaxID=2908210 RepID=UPI001F392D73|nr:helix-turn-helix domain-containing protein [Antarcticibacterium sp. 1MA-6-2]UJH91693.1 helix-turn-helix domain-containing protein [Antarcticibacterium sp. 1MA-6-2]
MKEILTFDQLPTAVTMLTQEISELKQLLLNKSRQHPTEQPEQLLTVQDTAVFLSLSVPTIYSKVSKGELPVMKRSKRLYFSRKELLEYVKGGRQQTNAEIESEANLYLKK